MYQNGYDRVVFEFILLQLPVSDDSTHFLARVQALLTNRKVSLTNAARTT